MRCLLLVVCVLAYPMAANAADNNAKRPTFQQITATVNALFAAEKDYRPGDLISRSQAQKAMRAVAALGFAPAGEADILANVLGDDEFLVTTFRTPGGKAFLRKVAKQKGAFDRLDRLSRMPHGRQTIQELMTTHGGDEVVAYMVSDAGGGAGLVKQLGASSKDFNKPTGRIYTAEDLLAALKTAYDAGNKPTAKRS